MLTWRLNSVHVWASSGMSRAVPQSHPDEAAIGCGIERHGRSSSQRLVGVVATAMRLCVNDHVHEVPVEPHELLVDTLRDRLGLTGTKQACGMGNCGTCTVRLDGETVYSCLVLTIECDVHEVDTIEGLADGDDL